MPKKKRKRLWSVTRITHPDYPGIVVRVGEYVRGGMLQVFRMINGVQKVIPPAPPAPGRPVAANKAGLAKHEVAVLNDKTGAETHYMVPVAPAIPDRATTPAS